MTLEAPRTRLAAVAVDTAEVHVLARARIDKAEVRVASVVRTGAAVVLPGADSARLAKRSALVSHAALVVTFELCDAALSIFAKRVIAARTYPALLQLTGALPILAFTHSAQFAIANVTTTGNAFEARVVADMTQSALHVGGAPIPIEAISTDSVAKLPARTLEAGFASDSKLALADRVAYLIVCARLAARAHATTLFVACELGRTLRIVAAYAYKPLVIAAGEDRERHNHRERKQSRHEGPAFQGVRNEPKS